MTRVPTSPNHEIAAREKAEPLAELVEQRARLENRLVEFHRIAARLGRTQLPAAGAGIAADLNQAVARFDADLTLLGNIVHDLLVRPSTSGVLVSQLIFVRVGGGEFALRVDDVREIRSWHGIPRSAPWHDRELDLIPLAAVLRLQQESTAAPVEINHKLIVVDCPPDTALLVEEVTRQDELIVRPLGPLIRGPFRGAVLGLGEQPILVLDPAQLVQG